MFNNPIEFLTENTLEDLVPVQFGADTFQNDYTGITLAYLLFHERYSLIDKNNGRGYLIARERKRGDNLVYQSKERLQQELCFREYNQTRVYQIETVSPTVLAEIQESLRTYYIRDKKYPHPVEELTNVEAYLWSVKKIKTAVFYCAEYRSTIIITGSLSISRWHAIMSALPALMPAFFEAKPLTEKERAILKALTEDTDANFRKLVNEYVNGLNIREEFIRRRLTGFANGKKERMQNRLQRDIDAYDNEITSLEERISDYYTKRESAVNQLIGLERLEDKADDVLIDYFIKDKELKLHRASKGWLRFEVKTALVNYDQDLYETYEKNKRGALYAERLYGGTDMYDGLKLLHAVFSEQKMDIMMKGMFTIKPDEAVIDIHHYDFTPFTADAIVNPHLYNYKCLGNNQRYIYDAIRKGDYLMAVALCKSAVGNLNFGESHNVQNFLGHLFSSQSRCVYLKSEDRYLTVEEAIAYLKGEDAANETNQTE